MGFRWTGKAYREAVTALIDSRREEPGWLYNSGVETTMPYKTHLLSEKEQGRRVVSISDLQNIRSSFGGRKGYDLFSEILLNKTNKNPQAYFSEVEPVLRGKDQPYNQTSHFGLVLKDSINGLTTRIEEHEERAFFNYYHECNEEIPMDSIGIVSYAMPLPKSDPDPYHLSEVDAIGLSPDMKTAYLLELKNMDSDETLLRSSLEIYTYYSRLALNRDAEREKTIKRMKEDFGEVFRFVSDIKPGVLLINGSKQFRSYKAMVESNHDSNLLMLMKTLGLEVFSVNKYSKEGQQISFLNDADVINYTSVDEEYAKPVLKLEEGEYIRIENVK